MSGILPGSTFYVRAAPNSQGGSSAGRLIAKWDYWLLWRFLWQQMKRGEVWAAEKLAVLKKQRHPGYSHVLEYLGDGWWAECGAAGVSVSGFGGVGTFSVICNGPRGGVGHLQRSGKTFAIERFRGDLFPPIRPLTGDEPKRLWQWWESHLGDGYGYGHLARMRWLAGLCRWVPVDLTRYKLTGSGMVCSTAVAKAATFVGRKLWPQLSDDVLGPMLVAYSDETDWEKAEWNIELPTR